MVAGKTAAIVCFERNFAHKGTGTDAVAALAALPFVGRTQNVFVLADLLQQVFKRALHGRRGGRRRCLHRHLTRGQAQIQGNTGALAGRDLFHHSLQVDELGTENLQAFLQFFDLVLDVFLDGGNFMKTITDVNVHERLGLAYEVRNQVLLNRTI